MKLPFRRRRAVSRGQALVEMAIILPVLVLLLLMAVDFGRVFFGWVALNNVTRIGANEAARFPTPWKDGVAQDASDPYYQRMIADMQSMNCNADVDSDGDIDENDLPDPVFTNRADDAADPYQVGDEVSVTLHCAFGVLTPLVGAILGDQINISATSTFLVFGGEINGIPVPVDPAPAGCVGTDLEIPDLTTTITVAQARTKWTDAGFQGTFSPSIGADDNIVVTQTTSPTSEPGDCRVYTASVTVTHKVPDGCAANETTVPQLVQSPAITVAQARTAWTGAGFSGGFTPLTGSDSDTVTAQTISPSNVAPGGCALMTSQVNVTHAAAPPPAGQCLMTQILGWTINAAQSKYISQGFRGEFSYNPTNKPRWVVKTQNLIGGQSYACTANLHVQLEAAP